MTERLVRLVEACRIHPWRVLAITAVLVVAAFFAITARLGIDTDTVKLLSPDLPWRQREIAFDAKFPQNNDLLAIVVDAPTPELAEDATARLYARLADHKELFQTVRRPDGGLFFQRNGLLFLSADEVDKITDQMIDAQPLIGALSADPTLRGLMDTLVQFIGQAAQGGQGTEQLKSFVGPLNAISGEIDAVVKGGKPMPLAWSTLFTGETPQKQEIQRFILTQPVLDYTALTPGATAAEFVRAQAAELGLTPENGVKVRLTGQVALDDDQFGTVSKGAGLSTMLALGLTFLMLLLALKSIRMMLAIMITLIAGLLVTGGFAALAIGNLNLISVAFAVLFVGIAVDFGIQFSIAYRNARYLDQEPQRAMRATAERIAPPLALAATTASVGFFSFLPTSYRGVSELGLIAGVGMFIALALTLTLLPALLTLFRLRGEPAPVGFTWAAPIDDLMLRRRGIALAIAAVATIGLAALLPRLTFDFNPLNLMDPKAESVATFLELMADPNTTPNTIDVLAPSVEEAQKLGERLSALPEVSQVVTLASYVPEDQPQKLDMIRDAALLLGPVLDPQERPAPTPQETRDAVGKAAETMEMVAQFDPDGPLAPLAKSIQAMNDKPETIPAVEKALLSGLPTQLKSLRLALSAEPVTLKDLPPELVNAWVAPDGTARLQVFPKGNPDDNAVLRRFVAAVRTVAPDATGTPVSIQESSRTIVQAFVTAGLLATGAITLLLVLVLKRLVEVALVLVPLLMAGLLTLATTVAIDLPLNFANIIALPLLLGIGVAFDIYFVTNWRAGVRKPLESATARAILFSALTTMGAFGSLAVSPHPGTADMGKLLALELAYTLLCTLGLLPVLLALRQKREPAEKTST